MQLKVAPAVETVSYTPGFSSYSHGGAVKYSSVGPAVHAYSSVDYTPGVTYAKSSGLLLASQSPSAQYAATSYAAAAPIVTKAYLPPPVTKVKWLYLIILYCKLFFIKLSRSSSCLHLFITVGGQHLFASGVVRRRSFG